MQLSFEIGDINEVVQAWERYREQWLSDLRKAKQPEPTREQIESVREIWVEGWGWGRKSK